QGRHADWSLLCLCRADVCDRGGDGGAADRVGALALRRGVRVHVLWAGLEVLLATTAQDTLTTSPQRKQGRPTSPQRQQGLESALLALRAGGSRAGGSWGGGSWGGGERENCP